MLLTRITLARISAPLQLRLQPEKLTVITEVLFFMALQRTATKTKKKMILSVVTPAMIVSQATKIGKNESYNHP